MILTVCPSPCIDVNIEVDSLGVGKSNKILSKHIFYTGNALNVATGISILGGEVITTGFMYDENGNAFEQQLHRDGVSYKFIWCSGRVRENYKFIDRRSMMTELNDVGGEIDIAKQTELLKLVGELTTFGNCEGAVISGDLAKGMNPDFYAKVLSVLPPKTVKVVDADGERLLAALKCGVDLIKPNIDEVERTLKTKITTVDELKIACRELIKLGTKYVLISLGKRGAVISDGNEFYHCVSVNVAMNSTIGAGDGMVAGATNALIKGAAMQDILRCGVAAGTASVTSVDSISFRKEKYEEILSTLSVKEI